MWNDDKICYKITKIITYKKEGQYWTEKHFFGKAEFVGLNNNTSHTPKRPVIEQKTQPTEIPKKTSMFCGQCGAKLGNGNFCPKVRKSCKK